MGGGSGRGEGRMGCGITGGRGDHRACVVSMRSCERVRACHSCDRVRALANLPLMCACVRACELCARAREVARACHACTRMRVQSFACASTCVCVQLTRMCARARLHATPSCERSCAYRCLCIRTNTSPSQQSPGACRSRARVHCRLAHAGLLPCSLAHAAAGSGSLAYVRACCLSLAHSCML